MKFGFVTCVQLGKSCIDAIYQVGGKLDLIITLTDSQATEKSGRVYLDEFCEKNNVPLLKSTHINNSDCIEAIREYELDWLFIIGWSQIANSEVLAAPKKGVLGIHPTLLPIGRGRAAIPWAILKGLDQTGVTLFKLDEGVDTGEIVDQLVIPLSNEMTASTLYELVNKAHINLIEKVFPLLQKNEVNLTIQNNSLATEWPGRGPSDGEINLNGSVRDAERLIRAVTKPYPGAFLIEGDKKYVIWSAKILEANNESSEKRISFFDGELVLVDYKIEDVK